MPRLRTQTRLRPFIAPPHDTPLLYERLLSGFVEQPLYVDPDAVAAVDLWPEGDAGEGELREACRDNMQLFCEHFFPELCRVAFNPLHLAMFARRDQRIRDHERGWRDVTAAPRGSGKTTTKQIEIVHDCLYKIEKYIGVGSANFDHARDKVKSIRDMFSENQELIRVYGEQETGTPSHPGRWAEHDFITRTGARVRAFTPKMKTRGFLWNGSRLTKALFDDVEDQDLVLTPLRRERLLTWLQSDIAKLGESDLNMDGIGTVLHPESMLATLLKNPGFQHSTYRAVTRFAESDEAVALWAGWRELVLNLDDPARLENAHAFYLAHEEAMLEGAEVLWPEAQSYEFLMLDRIIFGETAFWTERQNDPTQDRRYLFNMDAASYCTIHEDGVTTSDGRMVHFLDMVELAAFWDPTPDRQEVEGCYACCVVIMKDRHGYCYFLDSYCEQEPSTDAQMDGIAAMLHKWGVTRLGVESNGFQSLLPQEMRRKIKALADQERSSWTVSYIPIKNIKNKILRINSLDPIVNNGWLVFADTLPRAVIQQFRDYIPQEGINKFLDAPDACEGGLRVIGGLYDRRAAF